MAIASESTPADRIRMLREQLDFTQTQLAKHIGVTYVTVNRWENGKNEPNALAWEKILQIEEQAFKADGEDTAESHGPSHLDFDGKPEELRTVVDAERLRHAHHYNPAFASEISRIDPLPHQRIAVYQRMLPQPRLRFLLADDAGAGKTIMSGLYIREMLSRRLLRRILIVPPAGLVGNWQRELQHLFNLEFDIVSGYDARSGNPFAGKESDRLIVSVDTLAAANAFSRLADEETQPYDLIIFDEAHKLSVRRDPDHRFEKTKRYKLAEAIAGIREEGKRWHLPWQTHHLLLLTATPHMGKNFPYYGLWRLLEPDALSTQEAFQSYPQDARRRHFIRRTKEEMVRYDGEPIYPTRISNTLKYTLTPGENALYDATTEYLNLYYNQARMLNRSAMHLAKSVFQRRLASSTYALLRSFERRVEKLTELIEAVREARLSEAQLEARQARLGRMRDIFEDMTADEETLGEGREQGEYMEEKALATVADASLDKLEKERDEVQRLVAQAQDLYQQGDESKFTRLLEILDDPKYQDEKMLIFTEHRDTLSFIVHRLEALGHTGRLAQIHGGMPHEDRDEQVRRFRKKVEDGGAQYMIATDAAGEGINLQFCWLMVNYDVPWNPARLEQRMGRIHRYGQERDPVIIMNLTSKDTREGRVQNTLLEKLDRIRREFGSDKVFDVVGKSFEDVSLKQYIDRVLQGEDEEAVKAEIEQRVTEDRVREIEAEEQEAYGQQDDVRSHLPELREERDREKFRRLLPGFVQQFITHSASLLGLEVDGNVDGYFRLHASEEGALEPFWPLLEMYPEEMRERLTTHKPDYNEECIWLHPGEPLFDRLEAIATDSSLGSARRGAMFADAKATSPYLLYFLIVGIERGADEELDELSTPERRGERFVAVRADKEGQLQEVDSKSLLLLRPYEGSKARALDLIAISNDMVEQAEVFAQQEIARQMVRAEQERLEDAAQERLRFLERGFEYRKGELAEQRTKLGQQKKDGVPGADKAYAQIKEQQQRLRAKQQTELAIAEREPELIKPAGIELVASALILPSEDPEDEQRRDEQVERIAMQEAVAFERERGATVEDVSTPEKARAAGLQDWPGFDLLSRHPKTGRCGIEVKGRARIGDVVLHDNEWSAAITQRDDYWLYVVYDCATSNPRVLRIQDPFRRVMATPKGDVIIDEQEVFRAADRSK